MKGRPTRAGNPLGGKKKVPPVGELRQSQILTTFGPGAMVDLPDHAVLLGGLESWQGDKRRIYEDRLEERIRELLGLDAVALYAPPVAEDELGNLRSGITAFQFPTWFLAQIEQTYHEGGREYRTRPLVPWGQLRDGKYFDNDRKKKPVVPVRFVQACVRGHISDLDWYAFVRRDPNTDKAGLLWLDEGGAGNDFSDIFVRCERTRMRRPLADASLERTLGPCRGRMPWLGPNVHEACSEANRLLLRSASSAYFGRTERVIAIPDNEAALKAAVDGVYDDFLQYAEGIVDIQRERRKQKVLYAIEHFSDSAVWAEVARRKSGTPPRRKGIKEAEIETLRLAQDTIGEDAPDGDFYARSRDLAGLPPELATRLDRIVLVHRLREVVALVGFTRFEGSVLDVTGELSIGAQLAPLARETSWLPAGENRGEGIFLGFAAEEIEKWVGRKEVEARDAQLVAGFEAWKERKNQPNAVFPGLPYLLLHSLSHLLITAVALECGYSASSIRERVYASPAGYGILLYTAGAGTEGTLGGLVEVGRNIEQHLARALELGRLCSNDPVCAQHDPANPHEERFLHGSACHGCLLIAETCCESRNEHLDRALVVPTMVCPGAAFFADEPS